MKFRKSDLRDGDIVTYRYGDRRTLIKNTFECHNFRKSTSVLEHYNEDLTMKDGNKGMDIIKVERPVHYETVFERKEILNEVEKRYLRNVIRPFRNNIRYIEREDNGIVSRIKIRFDYHVMLFPVLEKEKKMYEGMQANRSYSIKELGL